MKNKKYKNGKTSFSAYMKPIGRSFECAVLSGGKVLFIGNFTKSSEANAWWSLMNREIRGFSKRYKVGTSYPATWFKKFLASHLNDKYFTFVNRHVARHHRSAHSELNRNVRKYKKLNRAWTPSEKVNYLKAA